MQKRSLKALSFSLCTLTLLVAAGWLQSTDAAKLEPGTGGRDGPAVPAAIACAAPEIVEQIRSDPKKIVASFTPPCAGEIRSRMGSNAGALDNADLFAIYAALIAYGMAPYGPNHVFQLSELLHAPYMDCDSYALLTGYLFDLGPYHSTAVQFEFVGLDGGVVGNHAQIFTHNTISGQDLMLDPTIALVAYATFNRIIVGYPVASDRIVDFSTRTELAAFRARIIYSLTNGKYSFSTLLYRFNSVRCYAGYSTGQPCLSVFFPVVGR